MISPAQPPIHAARGATLVEAVIAVGVLAVSIPLVFGTIAESGKVTQAAEAETRAAWIVPACLAEIDASRAGRPQFFDATKTGDAFPAAGDVWAIGFASDGRAVAKVSQSDYKNGKKPGDPSGVRYIASLSAVAETGITSYTPPMMRATIAIEYPASAPAEKRAKINFHTRIP